ncbi:fimbrial protein (plasmid) [Pantoea vagans]|uniref:fimbrial protein n=1 Tax=Pantoea vagans TaxID=470934 RepID=UPI003514BC89
MKSQFKVVALAAVLSAAAISTTQAADGTIQFQGEIIDAACDVTPATGSQIVTLGQVSAKAFTGLSSRAAATSFQIELANCPAAVSTASIKFDGTPYQGNNDTLQLTQVTGVATGVGVEIRDANGNGIPLFTNSTPVALSTTSNNVLNFAAGYVQRGATVTSGPANAVATFSVIYN